MQSCLGSIWRLRSRTTFSFPASWLGNPAGWLALLHCPSPFLLPKAQCWENSHCSTKHLCVCELGAVAVMGAQKEHGDRSGWPLGLAWK